MKKIYTGIMWVILVFMIGCGEDQQAVKSVPKPEFILTSSQTHNRFSSAIPPVIKVPSGAIVEVYTKEATDGQLTKE